MPPISKQLSRVSRPTPKAPFAPYWASADGDWVRLYQGDVRWVLRQLPARSVHCVVTSPPYFGLRDYGHGEAFPSEAEARDWSAREAALLNVTLTSGGMVRWVDRGARYDRNKGLWVGRVNCEQHWGEGEWYSLGAEPSPDCETKGRARCGRCFVCNTVEWAREVKRVLRDDGTFWLNLGDSYNANSGTGFKTNAREGHRNVKQEMRVGDGINTRASIDLAGGNLVGIPWRVALALQADGWILRQDVIWNKPSPMPESVRNRCTKAHEYVFLLTKSQRYFCDMEAIKERGVGPEVSEEEYAVAKAEAAKVRSWYAEQGDRLPDGAAGGVKSANKFSGTPPGGRNKRSVWSVDDHLGLVTWMVENAPEALGRFLAESGWKPDVWRVSSQGYPGAHFATYPPNLIRPMIRAGTSARGACYKCGAPWRRVVVEKQLKRKRQTALSERQAESRETGRAATTPNDVAGVEARTVGWQPTCECHGRFVKRKVVVERTSVEHGGTKGSDGLLPLQSDERGVDGDDTEKTVTEYVCECGVCWGAEETEKEKPPPEVFTDTVRPEDGFVNRRPEGGMGQTRDAWAQERDSKLREREADPCNCYAERVVPCTVLDPFIGSGTTCDVAIEEGRHSIGIDLSKKYLDDNAIPRVKSALQECPELAHLALKPSGPVKTGGRTVVRRGESRPASENVLAPSLRGEEEEEGSSPPGGGLFS